MIHKMYSIRDAKTEAFLQPVYMQTKGAFMRAMVDCVNDPGHAFNKHPEDYVAYELGEFDDGPGAFHIHDVPEPICKLIELVQPQQ